MENSKILYYANRFQEIFNGSPWYGETVASKLNDVSDKNAFIQPLKDIHSVAELVSHMTYWRKGLISGLQNQSFKTSMESPDNWLSISKLKDSGWKKVHAAFDESQQTVVELLHKQSDDFLNKEYSQGTTFESLIQGIIDHDIYHLGQIGLVKKMIEEK